MKNIAFLLIALVLLSACAQPPSANVQPMITLTPAVTPTADAGEGQSLASVETATAAAAPTASPSEPKSLAGSSVQWNPDPQSIVARVTNCCGLVPPLYKANYIPEAILWGDGRILWTQIDDQGRRSVLEGKLSQDQMTELLQKAAADGFFGWKELYKEALSPTDMPSKCIDIKLSSQEHRVCEYYKGAPAAFHALYDTLKQGAGVESKAYLPAKAYLKTYPVTGERVPANSQELPAWDAASASTTLEPFTQGAWVEGQALELAWKLVNTSALGIVRDGQNYYQLTLQIPGVSLDEPPAQ